MTKFQTIKQTFQLMKTKPHNLVKTFFIFIAALSMSLPGLANAATLQEQINSLNAQNSGLQAQRQNLLQEAGSLEAAIANLRAQINELQAKINANQAKMVALKVEIAEAEVEIAKQRELLGDNIRAMYLEGDISTIEMLASSNDLSEYLDKEQYRTTVQDKVKTTLDRINELKAQLEAQKLEIEKILADQRAIQKQLDAQRAEQAQLLALNTSQRNALNNQIQSNSGKIAELRRQQAAANARLFGGRGTYNVPDTTGYPWAGYNPFPNSSADPWGMYKRQCVSYTAWKVWKSGRHMPYWGGHGNANQWDDNARAAGIPTDGSPRVGDVAVSNSGYYGHVMYVEAVYGDGTIYVSQYNANWRGTYSEARVSAGGLVFIHF
jgi:surface antigen/regulator of replication initiation timing